MNKKLMLLVGGVLASVALFALPGAAAAGEFEVHCEGAATCVGEITANTAVPIGIQNAGGEKISCTGFSGSASFTSTTTTGTASLVFTGCKETVTIFRFNCNSTGAASGEIKVSNLTFHLVNLESAAVHAPGGALTNLNVTFECTGFSKKRVTGNVLGNIESACNTGTTTTQFWLQGGVGTGTQKYTQITTSGTVLDLISNNDTETGTYSTSSVEGTGILHWSKPVKLTC